MKAAPSGGLLAKSGTEDRRDQIQERVRASG